MSHKPWGVTEGEEHYCFGILKISYQPQFGSRIVGVLQWRQRDQGGGCYSRPGVGWSDIGRGYREEMASGNITEAELLWLGGCHSWGSPEACPRQGFKCNCFIGEQAAQCGRGEKAANEGSTIKPGATVGNWNSVPLGPGEPTSQLSHPRREELGY